MAAIHTVHIPPIARARPLPATGGLGLLLSAIVLTLGACMDSERAPPASVQAATSEEAGRYIFTIGGCNDCHTVGWAESGGKLPEKEWGLGNPVGYRGPWRCSLPAEPPPLGGGEHRAACGSDVPPERRPAPHALATNYVNMPDNDLVAVHGSSEASAPAGHTRPSRCRQQAVDAVRRPLAEGRRRRVVAERPAPAARQRARQASRPVFGRPAVAGRYTVLAMTTAVARTPHPAFSRRPRGYENAPPRSCDAQGRREKIRAVRRTPPSFSARRPGERREKIPAVRRTPSVVLRDDPGAIARKIRAIEENAHSVVLATTTRGVARKSARSGERLRRSRDDQGRREEIRAVRRTPPVVLAPTCGRLRRILAVTRTHPCVVVTSRIAPDRLARRPEDQRAHAVDPAYRELARRRRRGAADLARRIHPPSAAPGGSRPDRAPFSVVRVEPQRLAPRRRSRAP